MVDVSIRSPLVLSDSGSIAELPDVSGRLQLPDMYFVFVQAGLRQIVCCLYAQPVIGR